MDYLKRWLQEKRDSGNYRSLSPIERSSAGPGVVDLSSNDYLALSTRPELREAARNALEKHGTGAGAARLMSGDLPLFHELEEKVAGLKNQEAALLFGCGYMANVGVIPALVGRGDLIFSDRFNHASIYDGCRLSGARLIRFRHNDLDHLQECLEKERHGGNKALIVVESIYSMDGDRCPLAGVTELKNRYSSMLMVDEAHATGVFGANGGGVIQEDGLEDEVDVAMGTFGKALGSYGAYIAGSRTLKEYLVNRARSFIYSTALPPSVAAASLAAIKLIETEPGLRQELFDKTSYFKECLQKAGLPGEPGPSQIVPVGIGGSRPVVEMAEAFRKHGFYVTAVRPPTVPEGTARLRFSVTLHQNREQLREAAGLLMELGRELSQPVSFQPAGNQSISG